MTSEELRLLIENNDLNAIDNYINDGGDVNGTYSDGLTPLFIAMNDFNNGLTNDFEEDGFNCGEAIIIRLIKAGSDVHARNGFTRGTPLLDALKQRRRNEIIYELLSAGSEVNAECSMKSSPLMLAIIHNYDKDLIYNFIQLGANVNHKDKYGCTPLYYAFCRTDNYEIAETLIVAGANIDSEISWNILRHYLDCWCCKIGNCKNKKLIDFLVSKGFNLKMRFADNSTIIHHINCNYLISLCIKSGVSVESKDTIGYTPLIYALSYENFYKIKDLLMLFKADPNNCDNKLRTPLHVTLGCYDGSIRTCESLLYHGSNIFAKSCDNKTPFHLVLDKLLLGVRFYRTRNYWSSMLSHFMWYSLLYYDKHILCDYYSNLNYGLIKIFETLLFHVKKELSLMKQMSVKANLTFHDFCLLRRFYKSKRVDMSFDELNYNFDRIKNLFPIGHYSIITRIKDNIIKNNRRHLLHSLDGIIIRPLPVNENDSQVKLNYDCMYLIARYFNRQHLVTLFQASVET